MNFARQSRSETRWRKVRARAATALGRSAITARVRRRGKPHRYFFRLYALDEKLDLTPGSSNVVLQQAMKDHIIVEADYMGTYRR